MVLETRADTVTWDVGLAEGRGEIVEYSGAASEETTGCTPFCDASFKDFLEDKLSFSLSPPDGAVEGSDLDNPGCIGGRGALYLTLADSA